MNTIKSSSMFVRTDKGFVETQTMPEAGVTYLKYVVNGLTCRVDTSDIIYLGILGLPPIYHVRSLKHYPIRALAANLALMKRFDVVGARFSETFAKVQSDILQLKNASWGVHNIADVHDAYQVLDELETLLDTTVFRESIRSCMREFWPVCLTENLDDTISKICDGSFDADTVLKRYLPGITEFSEAMSLIYVMGSATEMSGALCNFLMDSHRSCNYVPSYDVLMDISEFAVIRENIPVWELVLKIPTDELRYKYITQCHYGASVPPKDTSSNHCTDMNVLIIADNPACLDGEIEAIDTEIPLRAASLNIDVALHCRMRVDALVEQAIVEDTGLTYVLIRKSTNERFRMTYLLQVSVPIQSW